MTAEFETVTRWFQKAIDNATNRGCHDSALLWSDWLAHLVALNDRAKKGDRYRKALEQIDKMGDLTDIPFRKAGGMSEIFRIVEDALRED